MGRKSNGITMKDVRLGKSEINRKMMLIGPLKTYEGNF